ncbi:porin [Marinobacterium lutimaris]|uniref:Porin n=1 Tax=Marinobacterium lutimaris TaxID=568106 RepID=A0A1H6C1D5_9GAMM|nr:porin [Marinobacterium lutimaris]SEG66761.1 porin [Marinobacterium lutimaris]
MKNKFTGLTLSALFTAVLGANAANAAKPEIPLPEFTMFTSLGVLNVEDKDYDPEAFEAEFGLKGLVKLDEFKMLYVLNVDVSDAINSEDTGGSAGESDIHVKDAKVIFPTQYGTFVLAPRGASGQLRDLYSNINIFEYNETHSGKVTPTGMAGIFGQADEGQDILAYVTPAFYNIKFTASALSVREANDNEIDVKSFRLIYDDGALHLGAGLVIADEAMAGADDDYKRAAFSAGYRFSNLDLGATYEINTDTFGPAGDYDSYGLTGRYHFSNGYSAALGYFNKDSDVDANDNDGVVVQVKKTFNANVAAWAEAGSYDITPDNFAVGVNIKF